MRKVKFPFDLDTTPFLTDDLKERVKDTTAAIKRIEKERDERVKIKRRAKARQEAAAKHEADVQRGLADAEPEADAQPEAEAESKLGVPLTDEEEKEQRAREAADVLASIHADVRADVGANPSALYELVGIVTHKGAAADAGHYISWVRNEDEKDSWFKFDDDKVSTISRDKIALLDGGGEGTSKTVLAH